MGLTVNKPTLTATSTSDTSYTLKGTCTCKYTDSTYGYNCDGYTKFSDANSVSFSFTDWTNYKTGHVFTVTSSRTYARKKTEYSVTISMSAKLPSKTSSYSGTYGGSATSLPFTIPALPSYTVTLKNYDGTTYQTLTKWYDESLSLPQPTREGYAFDGWTDGTNTYTTTYTSNSANTLNPIWRRLKSTVNFYNAEGLVYSTEFEVGKVPSYSPQKYESTIDNNMVFVGWDDEYDNLAYDENLNKVTDNGVFWNSNGEWICEDTLVNLYQKTQIQTLTINLISRGYSWENGTTNKSAVSLGITHTSSEQYYNLPNDISPHNNFVQISSGSDNYYSYLPQTKISPNNINVSTLQDVTKYVHRVRVDDNERSGYTPHAHMSITLYTMYRNTAPSIFGFMENGFARALSSDLSGEYLKYLRGDINSFQEVSDGTYLYGYVKLILNNNIPSYINTDNVVIPNSAIIQYKTTNSSYSNAYEKMTYTSGDYAYVVFQISDQGGSTTLDEDVIDVLITNLIDTDGQYVDYGVLSFKYKAKTSIRSISSDGKKVKWFNKFTNDELSDTENYQFSIGDVEHYCTSDELLTSLKRINSSETSGGNSIKGVIDKICSYVSSKVDNTQQGANKLISNLPVWSASPNDNSFIIRQSTTGTDAYGRIPASLLFSYIDSKMWNVEDIEVSDSIFGTISWKCITLSNGLKVCMCDTGVTPSTQSLTSKKAEGVFTNDSWVSHYFTLPIEYNSTPYANMSLGSNGYTINQVSTVTTTQVACRVWGSYSQSTAVRCRWLVIGF